MMKRIDLHGIPYLEPLNGNCGWYWGSDYTHGDLYEAEELFRDQHSVQCSRLVFVHYPDGRVVEPIQGKEGQYFGRPIFFDGKLQILLVDFPNSLIQVFQYDDVGGRIIPAVSLSLTEVKDCYNLVLCQSPLMLTRQGNDGKFQSIWPEKFEFDIRKTETFFYIDGDRMYFSRWFEEPDYREEVVVRQYPTGEVLECIPGALMEMPDGRKWILQ